MKRVFMLLGIAALACGGSATDGDGAAGGAAGSAGTGATAGTAGSGAAAGAAGSGGGAASGGAAGAGGGSLCEDLKSDYMSLVTKAQACPLNSTQETCNVWVDQQVGNCGYFAWGDASNVEVLAELKKINDDFVKSCPPALAFCPTGGFPPTMPAKCVDTGQGGTTGICVQQTP